MAKDTFKKEYKGYSNPDTRKKKQKTNQPKENPPHKCLQTTYYNTEHQKKKRREEQEERLNPSNTSHRVNKPLIEQARRRLTPIKKPPP